MMAYRRISAETEPKAGYKCSLCSEQFASNDYRSVEVIYNPVVMGDHNGVADADNDINCHQCSGRMVYIQAETGSTEDAWLCGDGCFHHDEGPKPVAEESTGEVWVCGECSEEYSEAEYGSSAREDAAGCCQ